MEDEIKRVSPASLVPRCCTDAECNYLPLSAIAAMMPTQGFANTLFHITEYISLRTRESLYNALYAFAAIHDWSPYELLLHTSSIYAEISKLHGTDAWKQITSGLTSEGYPECIGNAIEELLVCASELTSSCPRADVYYEHVRLFAYCILNAIWHIDHSSESASSDSAQLASESADTCN